MSGRLAVPVHSPAGDLLAYAGRSLDDEGNWLFPPAFEPSLELYNIHQAMGSYQNDGYGLIVVADPLEVWELHEAGMETAVALMAATPSTEQIELLSAGVGASGRLTFAATVTIVDVFFSLHRTGLWISWQDFSFASRHRKVS